MRVALAGALALSGALVAVASVPAPASAEPCGPQGNEIACENSKPGTDPEIWDITGAGDSDIQGFATDISVNVGQRIDFKIDTSASTYTVDIYRTGWYGGDGARLIASVNPSASLPQNQPTCITDATTEIYDCGNWSMSASWNVPSTAVSGVYVAKLTRADTGGSSHITFVVRDDSSDSDLFFQTSDPTWQAYNRYGGSDFYRGGNNGRAYKLSYNRPFATRGSASGRDFYFSSEYAMVRFLERNGYDVSYTSGLDSHRRGNLIKNHKVFLSVGHDEYWSGQQRANIEAARDAGVSMVFATGNEAYWRTRWEASTDSSGTPHRTLVSYKETWANAKIDPAPEWTGTWRDPRFAPPSAGGGLPENGLTGTAYMVNFSDLPVTVSKAEGKLRMWRHTPLATMTTSSQELAPHTVGYESNEDLDNVFRPQGLIRLSTTTGEVPEYLQDFGNTVRPGTTTHHITMYRAASGALVWSSASIQWAWGLDQTHDGDGAAADPRIQQAQVNLLADMGAQPTTIMASLTKASKSTDSTGPTTTIQTPAGGQVANGVAVTATGTATDSGGGIVAGVEVSSDGGETWHRADGSTSWSYSYVQHGMGATPLKARAIDDSGNIGAPAIVERTVTCPCSVYGQTIPAIADSQDGGGVELGLRFSPTTDGYISGVRFYKSEANTGTHTGSLWSASGVRLASVTFSNETASGWQSATFSAPVPAIAGQTFVVSYTAPNGRYAAQNHAFWYAGFKDAPLNVAGGYDAAPAGVYGSPGSYPSLSYNRGQYYVDAIFTETDASPLTVTDPWPLPGSSSVPATTTISAKFSKLINQSSVSFAVTNGIGGTVSGATTYDSASRTATFTPDAPLDGFVEYQVVVTAQDKQGNNIESGSTWSFRTAKPEPQPGVCPCSLFSESTVPETLQANDPGPVTLGVRFIPQANGTVTGVSFYKGPNNGGTHVGELWRADGTKLAEAAFTGESTSGWQYVTFEQPVSVTKNVEYVAAYRAPQGNYSYTAGGLADPINKDPLVSGEVGGHYTYTDGFPTQRSVTNYMVDVQFERRPPSIAVSMQDPAPGAVDVARGTRVHVSFTAPVRSGYALGLSVGGEPVAGDVVLSSDSQTLTFTPASKLPAGAQVEVALSGVVSDEGAALPNQNWTFTTTSAAIESQTLFGNQLPQTWATDDGSAIEVGVAFTPGRAGKITQIRFFKGTGNAGVHTGSLWSNSGQRLATVTFENETSTGWQTANLTTPVEVTAGTTYVASYYAPQGHYSSSLDFFASPWKNDDLTAPSSNNGRYFYGVGGGFPQYSYRAANYFVDVTFAPDTVELTIESRSPAAGATSVPVSSTVTVNFSAPLADGASLTLSASGPINGAATLSTDRKRLTFTPDSPLPETTAIAVNLSGAVSTEGAVLADQSWSFTTDQAGATPPLTMFGDLAPEVPDVDDSSAIELGTAFVPSEDGTVTGVRFFKGTGNGGTHTGSLWTASETLLATATFAGESSTGWQTVEFSSPVAVTAGQTYVVSYYAPQGHYSATGAFFTEPFVAGPLTAPAGNNGRYRYGAGGGFPSNSWNSANYFVDVVFRTASP